MKSGFLIRGQVPSLKGKALRKSPDASRSYPSWSRNLSLFQVKYKIPREGKRNFCYSCRFKIRESFVFKDFLLFEFIMNGIASQRRNTSLPENFLSSWRLRIRNPLDLDSEGVLAFFCVRPLQLTTWYTTRKNRASPMEGGPVFLYWKWLIDGVLWKIFIFSSANWWCPLKIGKTRREGNQKIFQSALAGDCFFSSGKIPGGMNSAVAGMMTGAGMPGPDQATDMWSGPPSSLWITWRK